jgi:hypothetical protein
MGREGQRYLGALEGHLVEAEQGRVDCNSPLRGLG